jgi:hypothetical protein
MASNNDQQIEFEKLETEANEARRHELELGDSEKADREATEEEAELKEEILRSNQLAQAQNIQQEEQKETAALRKISQSFKGPSLFKYGILLLMFAIPNDLIDLLDLTAVGMIVSWIVSALLSAGTIIVTWLADSELKRAQGHMKNIQRYQQATVRTMTKVASKLARFAPRNPVMKVVAGTVLEMIPIISILPWSSICVFLAYQDERHTFKEVEEQSKELSSLSESTPEMV